MWLYITFFHIVLSNSGWDTSTPYRSKKMCEKQNDIDKYKACNDAWTKKVLFPPEDRDYEDILYQRNRDLDLIIPNICMDMMWMIVNIDPFWSFVGLIYGFEHYSISERIKSSCWPTISNYRYEYKKYYIGKNNNSPLFGENIRNLSKKRLKKLLSLCEGKADKMPTRGSSREKICKKIGLYLVLDILHAELLGRPSWFLTLLDPNSAKKELSFLRDHKVKNVKKNEYLKMYNAFVDRIVPDGDEQFLIVENCNDNMKLPQKSLCYIQSIRTVFDLGTNVDIQHYHIHSMVTGKRLNALNHNYGICNENKKRSFFNLCHQSYLLGLPAAKIGYPSIETAKLSGTTDKETHKNILTYMRGRANYEFWQELNK